MTVTEVENEKESLFPRKSDRLFVGDQPDWENNACINVVQGDSFPYIDGYLIAGRLLADEVITSQRNQDFLIYPVIFLYRHHIELCLKDILRNAFSLEEKELTKEVRQHLGEHKLPPLWRDIEPVLATILGRIASKDLTQETIDGIDSYLSQLADMDGDSFRFRYPKTKKGMPSLPPMIHRINIRHFSETIERLINFLAYISDGLDALQEQKSYGRLF